MGSLDTNKQIDCLQLQFLHTVFYYTKSQYIKTNFINF